MTTRPMAWGGVIRRGWLRVRPAVGGLLVCVAVVSASGPASAQTARGDSAAFTVRDVPVDRTAVSAAAAREAALLDGQRAAFRRLLERLVPQASYGRLPALSDAQISDLVQNYEVQSERTSAVRYIATLTYRFKPDDVRTLLRTANLQFAETYAKPFLVLPVLREEGVDLLWDQPNPWRDAWGRLPPVDGLAPLVLPKGDLVDIQAINGAQAHSGDDQRLTAIARRYGVSGVYVAEAELETAAGAPTALHVSLIGYGGAAGEQTIVDSYAPNPGEDLDAFLQRTALAVTNEIEERWKGGQLLQFGHEATLTVVVNYDDISQWVGIRRRLADLALIRRTDLMSLTRSQAVVDIVYIGDDSQLRLALAQRDLALVPVAPAAPSSDDAAGAANAAAPSAASPPLWQLTMTGPTSNAAAPSQPRPSLGAMISLPNFLSFARLLSVPVIIWLLIDRELAAAFWLFVAAGVTDALDGFLAKRFNSRTELGSYLDPLADKALLVGVYVTLGWTRDLPVWLVILVVFRDLTIVGGALLEQTITQSFKSRPMMLSKINTALQIALAALVLARLGLGFDDFGLTTALIYAVAATTVASGLAYLVHFTRRLGQAETPP